MPYMGVGQDLRRITPLSRTCKVFSGVEGNHKVDPLYVVCYDPGNIVRAGK